MSNQNINRIMEEASDALAKMEYLRCEKLCLEGLKLARDEKDYDTYARILMPLQEARRQRRQAAEDAGVFLVTGEKLSAEGILDAYPEGCLILQSDTYTEEDLHAVRELACEKGLLVEVLLVTGKDLLAMFLQQMESQGDEALAQVDSKLTGDALIDALQGVIEKVGDHEIAHQRLKDAAKAILLPQD